MAFFPESEQAICQGHNIVNAIAFTTSGVPEAFTCLNLPDLFSQRSNYSSQDLGNWSSVPAHKMNYTLANAASYSPTTNYTRIWYHLGWPNPNGRMEEGGGWGPWTLNTFSFPNCSTVSTVNGGDNIEDDPKDNPWFGASCRTKEGGECEKTP